MIEHEHFLGCSARDEPEFEITYRYAYESLEDTMSGDLIIVAASDGRIVFGRRSEIAEEMEELAKDRATSSGTKPKNSEPAEYLEFCWTRPRDADAIRDLARAMKLLELDQESS